MGILSHHIWGWGYSPTPFMEKYTLPLPNWGWVYSPTLYADGNILPPNTGKGILSHPIWGCVYLPTPYMDVYTLPPLIRMRNTLPPHMGIGVLSHLICRWVYSPTPQTWDSQSVSGQSKCQSVPQGVNLFPRVSIRAQGVNIFEWFF